MAKTYTRGLEPVAVAAEDNLTTTLWRRAAHPGGREILRHHVDGAWRGLTWQQLANRVEAVAAGLIAEGVERGDRVALMASTRLDWTVADLAILAAGGVTVPLYETSSVDQSAWVLSDSGAKLAIAGSADNAKTLEAARPQVPALGDVFVLDDGGLDTLVERGDAGFRERVADRVAATGLNDVASIIYTSGTTGSPKGCTLSHGNLLSTARQSEVQLAELFQGEASTLLFLPLAHVFARVIQFTCLEGEAQIVYARRVDSLADDLVVVRPTFLLAVPRVFEKVFNAAQRKAEGPKARIFQLSVDVGGRWSEARNAGRSPGLVLTLAHRVMDKLVYGKLRAALGGRIRYCLSGGAPLTPHLAHFFEAAGIPIMEGYGLTETTAATAVNRVTSKRLGTVGLPNVGVEIQVADDGELLVRGPGNFQGYWHDEAATREVLDADGWFHTGDLGEIDDDGFVRITGRKKEIIVTAGGKNVAPAVLEERMKAHRLVSQAVVVGEGRPFIAALVTLDPEELAAFARDHGLDGEPAELARTPEVEAEVHKAVEHANRVVSRAESIRKVRILGRELSQEAGELTPKLSVRRQVVAATYADEIEQLYAG